MVTETRHGDGMMTTSRRRFLGSLGLATLLSTRPAAAAELLSETVLQRIALGSCADQKLPQPIWTPIRAFKPQLFLMMGDNVYGDVSSGALTELRAAYARLAAIDGFKRLRAEVPVLATWDDHDYGANDAGADFPHRAGVTRLFREFWGVPADGPQAGRDGIYDAHVFGPPGRRLQVILLDTRSFRSGLKPTDRRGAPGRERYLPDPDPAKTMLGPAQWAWLDQQLRQPADLRLIVSSIQVLADGHGYERWGNLPTERQRLIDLIGATRANGVVFLSGDRHIGALYRRAGGVPYPFHEITSSSLNRSVGASSETGPHQVGPVYAKDNFGVIEIDWQHGGVMLALRDNTGARVHAMALSLADLQVR